MCALLIRLCLFFFNDTATTEIYTLSLHDALPISGKMPACSVQMFSRSEASSNADRSEEHTSELQSLRHLVCRLLLEIKNKQHRQIDTLPHPSTLFSHRPHAALA